MEAIKIYFEHGSVYSKGIQHATTLKFNVGNIYKHAIERDPNRLILEK